MELIKTLKISRGYHFQFAIVVLIFVQQSFYEYSIFLVAKFILFGGLEQQKDVVFYFADGAVDIPFLQRFFSAREAQAKVHALHEDYLAGIDGALGAVLQLEIWFGCLCEFDYFVDGLEAIDAYILMINWFDCFVWIEEKQVVCVYFVSKFFSVDLMSEVGIKDDGSYGIGIEDEGESD